MTSVVKVSNFDPSILGNIIGFTFLGGFIGVLRTNSIYIVLGLVLELAVQVSQLMTWARILHGCTGNYFVSLLINHVGLSRVNTLDFILTFLSTDNKDLVLSLDWGELLRQSVSVAQLNALCCLTWKLMDVKFFSFFIEIVKARAARCQDIIGLKADNVM